MDAAAAAHSSRPLTSSLASLRSAIADVVLGKGALVEQVLTALVARGHLLIEDVPGVGKTTLAQAVADAAGGSFSRIQFTADLLPSDLLGLSTWDPADQEFRFHPGPVFAHVVLADEINRTPPKTQSSLLEAMNEGQVSLDGVVHALPRPFLVLATQNPLEHHGTFPLPESQLDRFLMRLSVGYPDPESERALLRDTRPRRARTAMQPAEILALQEAADDVVMHRDIEDYLLAIVRATRRHEALALGISPRGAQALARACRARALVCGRDHVIPDDVLEVAEPVLAHRLLTRSGASAARTGLPSAAEALAEILARVSAPV